MEQRHPFSILAEISHRINASEGRPVDIKLQLEHVRVRFIQQNIQQISATFLIALELEGMIVVNQRDASLLAALSRPVQAHSQSTHAIRAPQFWRKGRHYDEGTTDIEAVVQFALNILL